MGATLGLLGVPVALCAQRWPAAGSVLGVALALALAWHLVRRPREGAFALVALAPLTDMAEVLPGSGVRLSYVAAAAAATGIALLALRDAKSLPRPRWEVLALAAPLAAALASIPMSVDPGRSALYAGRLALLLVVVALVGYAVRDADDLRRALGTMIATGVALSSVALAQVALPAAGIGRVYVPVGGDLVGRLRPAAFLMDPNFLGGLLAVCALTAAVICLWSGRRGGLVWGAASVACAFGMALTLSRSAWLGFGVAAVLLVAGAPRTRRVAAAAVLAAFLAAAALSVPGTAARFAGGIDGSARTRLELLSGGLAIAVERPLTGTGLATLGTVYGERGGAQRTGRILDPHQVPLTVLAETGLPGVLAMGTVVAALVAAARRRRAAGWRPEDAALAVGLVALGTQSLFQNYVYFEPVWLILAMALAPGGWLGARDRGRC